MSTRTACLSRCLLLLLAAVPLSHTIAAQRTGEAPSVTRNLGDDTFAAGSRVRVTQDIAGDAIAAGADINLSGAIGGDAVAAGRRLTLRSVVAGDLYAAGGEVIIEGTVGGNARVAGGTIVLEPAGEIHGGASVAGGDISIDGRVGRYLQVAAGKTRINGRVNGDVEVNGGQLQIGPQAVIDGAVRFRGPQPPDVVDGAQVRGGVHHVEDQRYGRDGVRGALRNAFGIGAWLWLAGWLVVGSVLIAVAPGLTATATQAAKNRPGWSLLSGLFVLIGTPVLILISMVTLIGIPFGLLLLATYLMWLPLGYLVAAAALGEWLLLRRARDGREATVRSRMLAFCAVLFGLFLLTRVPIAGPLLALLVMLMGMGSMLLAVLGRRGVKAAPAS